MVHKTLGLLGTGLMGTPMAARLLGGGHRVVVWNRSREKTEPLAAEGAEVAPNPAAVLTRAEAVILMLSDAAAVREVLFSAQAERALPGKTVIQMGTIAPADSHQLATAVEQAGGAYFECPVLGSIPEARAGNLILMLGGTEAQLEQWADVLQRLGRRVRRVGPVGAAAALKLALNQLIAALTCAYGLAIGFAAREGVSIEVLADVIRESALYAPTFDKKLARMTERHYDKPNFPTRHLLKDVRLFLSQAAQSELGLDALAGVERILARAVEGGWGEMDYSALFEIVCPPEA
jgi:3-hydroxyisobutyrate dehydrogenase